MEMINQSVDKEVSKKYVYITIIVTSVVMAIPAVYANTSVFEQYFQNPNVELELDENNAVIIPDNVGHLNKQYDHEEFATLQQLEIEKAEKIRDKLIYSAIKEDGINE